jgi:tetratricopeptide (TPR) repeat protein
VSKALARLAHLSTEHRFLLSTRNTPELIGATVAAYSGCFAEARGVVRAAMVQARERGDHVAEAHLPQLLGLVELLAGDAAAAERVLRVAFDRLGELGEQGWRASIGAMLAEALARQGRDEEALKLIAQSNGLAQADDFDVHARTRTVHALILVRERELAEAEGLAREAVGIVAQTDAIVLHGDALLALAEAQRASGASEASKGALRQALALYERKENVVQAHQTRALLAELETSSPTSVSPRGS